MRQVIRVLTLLSLSAAIQAAVQAAEFPTTPIPLATEIVDAETGHPIEGAVVLAYWIKCYPSLGGWAGCEFSDAEEAVTGPDGRYSIRKRFTYEIPLVIQVSGPNVVIFKSGYGLWKRRLSGDTEVMALPPTRTREERLDALRAAESPRVPLEFKQRLQEAIARERKSLGFK